MSTQSLAEQVSQEQFRLSGERIIELAYRPTSSHLSGWSIGVSVKPRRKRNRFLTLKGFRSPDAALQAMLTRLQGMESEREWAGT